MIFHLYIFINKSVKVFCLLFKNCVISLMLNFENSIYIFCVQIFCEIPSLQIFSSNPTFFIILIVPLAEQKCLILKKSNFFFFSFIVHVFGVISWLCLNSGQFFSSLAILAFTFRFIIHFQLFCIKYEV